MASMDDLLASLSGDLHAGPKGNDLRDLHAKLTSTLNNSIPHIHHRPIPPPATSITSSVGGPLPPPAPASSWNTPPPNTGFLFSSSPQPKSFNKISSSPNNYNNISKKEKGFVPTTIQERDERDQSFQNQSQSQGQGQGNGNGQEDRPYHASVLPIKASPKETPGFAEDAFRPIWDGQERNQWNGFKQQGT
ncbi:uncharacterized protein IL334_004716 [Kwoniella shivajii]|uniref:Cytoplasmic protein n=1 Tax=Kwoniella shivajii TaxID=564305 RepID=A0ABZ1D305_9TREE|nr:hypothetical protein IL334_004716 [Kwoniella shivajii]